MKGSLLNKLLGINAEHALYRKDGKWYHNLKDFPGVLFDENGYIIFRTQESYTQHDHLQIKKDLHIIGGISTLPDYQPFTPHQKKLITCIGSKEFLYSEDFIETFRVVREVNIILRKRSLVQKMKMIYDNTCQLCGIKLAIGGEDFYSEVHHIIPLGEPHNGPDDIKNMICVCPNHHVQLDLKAIRLDLNLMKLVKHKISSVSINHHNSHIEFNEMQKFHRKKIQYTIPNKLENV